MPGLKNIDLARPEELLVAYMYVNPEREFLSNP